MTRAGVAWRLGLLAAWVAFAFYALAGVGSVPFHPDESTYLFMSHDFDLLVVEGRLGAVSWQAVGQPVAVRRYRLLDAPMVRYLNGLGRALAGEPALAGDWNWSASWEANAAAGAVPNPRALLAARIPATLLIILSVPLVFAIGARLSGRWTGLGAALLYALSGLLLLHGRRAMSEGPMLFFALLTFWLLLRPRPQPALVGLALSAAVAAKLTGLALLPVVVLALLPPWPAVLKFGPAWRSAMARLLGFGMAWLLALWALHPALWVEPLAGLRAMGQARQAFLYEQTLFIEAVAPHLRLPQLGLRALAVVYHLFFAPLAYADVGNYAAATLATEQRYAALRLNLGWRAGSLLGGSLVLGLALVGISLGGWRQWALGRAHAAGGAQPGPNHWSPYVLLAVWTVMTIGLLLAIAVPAQRYYLPLLPIACVWAAHGLTLLAQPLLSAGVPARLAMPATHE